MKTDIRFEGVLARLDPRWTVACLVLLLASASLATYQYRQVQALQDRNQQLGQRSRARALPARPARQAEEQAVAAVIRQINAPFDTILSAVTPPRDLRIALLGLQFGSVQGGTIKVSGEAQDYVTITNYLAWLEARPALHSARLISHEVDPVAAGTPVRFQMELKWKY